MREFKLIVALGTAMGSEKSTGPTRTAFKFAVKMRHLLPRSLHSASSSKQHTALYRAWAQRNLPGFWFATLEDAVCRNPEAWMDYVGSLNSEDAHVRERQHLLQRLLEMDGFVAGPRFLALADQLESEARGTEAQGEDSKASTGQSTQPSYKPGVIAVEATTNGAIFFTQSQGAAFRRILGLADLFFSGATRGSVVPRTAPLLVSPTGSGKTAVVSRVAQHMGAHLLRLTVAEWIPIGASRDLTPSLVQVADALANHGRVVLFVDELCKFVDDGKSWSRSSACEVFNLLERTIPNTVLALDRFDDAKRKQIQERARTEMFLVGAGAWQSLHEQTPKAAVGFHRDAVSQSAPVLLRAIKEAGFPAELLGRFHSSPIPLPYPSREETKIIFQNLGVDVLAARLGETRRLENFTWEPFGFRMCESLVADLLVLEREKSRDFVTEQTTGGGVQC